MLYISLSDRNHCCSQYGPVQTLHLHNSMSRKQPQTRHTNTMHCMHAACDFPPSPRPVPNTISTCQPDCISTAPGLITVAPTTCHADQAPKMLNMASLGSGSNGFVPRVQLRRRSQSAPGVGPPCGCRAPAQTPIIERQQQGRVAVSPDGPAGCAEYKLRFVKLQQYHRPCGIAGLCDKLLVSQARKMQQLVRSGYAHWVVSYLWHCCSTAVYLKAT
jgi:hypothetical protein